jgi:hypothetical protein
MRAARHTGLKPLAALAAPLLLLLLFLALPAAADAAGTYTVYVCRTPTGAAARFPGWRVDKGVFVSIDVVGDSCPSGPFQMEMIPSKTHPANDAISATVEAPAGTEIQSYKFYRSVVLASKYAYRYRELTAGGATEWDVCWGGQGCPSKGNPAEPFSAGNAIGLGGRTGVTGLQFQVYCELADSSTEDCPATSPGAKLDIWGGEMKLVDNSAPVLPVAPSGPLVTPGAQLAGTEPVSISATDTGSGVYQAMLEVDGTIVSRTTLNENGGFCKPPYISVAPCPPSASGTVSLDTTKFPDGEHKLRILVDDATGTNVTAWGPVSIQIHNDVTPVEAPVEMPHKSRCYTRPSSEEFDLHVGLVGRTHLKARAITTRFGRSLRVHGRLMDGKQPIANARICVAEREADGIGHFRKIGGRVTNANGNFTYKVEPGPSRRLFFVHRNAAGAAVRSVAVRVRAPVSLHGTPLSLRNFQTLTMRGRLGSPPFPRRGVLVELQAFRETGWQTFGTASTNRRGRYSYRYTFSRTVGLQHYLLRARVPKQADYPFESGNSRALKVTASG